jgi:type 1 glutamine amidotransferase
MINKKFKSVLFLSILFLIGQLTLAQTGSEMDKALTPFVLNQATAKQAKSRNVLVYNAKDIYYHADAIRWASRAIVLTGEKTGAYKTTETSDPGIFTKEKLAQFDAIVLNNSHGNVYGNQEQADARKQAIIEFVTEGKGLIALHATAAFDNSNPPTETEKTFRTMIGGELLEHPWNYDEYSPITIRIEDKKHPVIAAFGKKQDWLLPFRDELFQFTNSFSREDVRVLFSLNMELTPDKGSNPNKDYPLAWIKNQGKGRVFYSALGHSGDTYQDPTMLSFLLSGIQFAVGDLKADVTPLKQSKFNPEKGYVSIFNGKDLKGWRGESRIWSVEDNCITGQTNENITVDKNNYLIWEGGQLKDFELKAKFKLIGGNSGIYFHSYERTPDAKNSETLVGVQADFSADYVWVGTIMEYTLREKLAERGRKVVIKEDGTRVDAGSTGNPDELLKIYKENDWNDYHVIVRDNLIVLRINDVVMSEIRDYDKARLVSGLLALQVHVGPPMKVQFKDIRIKKY